MDAARRIQQAFHGSAAELSAFLDRVRLNAMTTLPMMFQNPAIPDSQQAADDSVELLLQEAGGQCQDAGLSASQRDQFLEVHRQAATAFRQALSEALGSGIPSDNRAALAARIAQLLQLPT